jgi:manganese/iron transport system permease protein
MLLAPAASAALFSRKITTMILTASLLGAISVYAGLLASYHFDLAAGASITLAASTMFFLLLAAKRLFQGRVR